MLIVDYKQVYDSINRESLWKIIKNLRYQQKSQE